MADNVRFLQEAQLIVPAGSAPCREIGANIEKCTENDPSIRKGSLLHSCPFCHSLLVPSLTTISTISQRKLKKCKQHFPVMKEHLTTKLDGNTKNQKPKHFMKIHCKVCKRTHLVPCSREKEPTSSSSNPSFKTPSSARSTPARRRRSLDLKSLLKQATPKTPPTPSLLDFLYT